MAGGREIEGVEDDPFRAIILFDRGIEGLNPRSAFEKPRIVKMLFRMQDNDFLGVWVPRIEKLVVGLRHDDRWNPHQRAYRLLQPRIANFAGHFFIVLPIRR